MSINNTMSFEDFKTTVKERIGDYLTEDYKDATFEIQEVNKSNGVHYDGLLIRKPTEERYSVIPVLNLTDAYQMYQSGDSIEEICEKLADIRLHAPLPAELDAKMFEDYEKAKGKIFPRLLNPKACNPTWPSVMVEDLAVVFTLRIEETSKGFSEAVIDSVLMNIWGVTVYDLYETSMENLGASEPVFCTMEEAMFGTIPEGESRFDLDAVSSDGLPLFILTNRQKHKGSALALCPKVMDKIVAKFGDVFVLPSSVDEVIILPKSATPNIGMVVDDLLNMVKAVNEEAVRPEDRLSDNVYEYGADSHRFTLAVK